MRPIRSQGWSRVRLEYPAGPTQLVAHDACVPDLIQARRELAAPTRTTVQRIECAHCHGEANRPTAR